MNPTLPIYFLHILQGRRSNAQVLTFVLNSLRGAEFLLSLVEDPTIWEQGKKDSLSRDKQYDLVFFLMYNRFLNYKVFSQNGRYYSSIKACVRYFLSNFYFFTK